MCRYSWIGFTIRVPLRGTKSAAFGRFPAVSAMNDSGFPFRSTKSAAFGHFPAVSAMNAGGFPFRSAEETAFGRFPAVSAMAGRFCRVHGRRRICGMGSICGMGRIAEKQRCSSYGEREISRRRVLSRFGEDKCYAGSCTLSKCAVCRPYAAAHLASVQCASHMRQHT